MPKQFMTVYHIETQVLSLSGHTFLIGYAQPTIANNKATAQHNNNST